MANPDLSRVATSELRRELERRVARLDRIESRRTQLEAELTNIDAELTALRGAAPMSRAAVKRHRPQAAQRRRARSNAAKTRADNAMTLTEALQRVLRGKTMRVGEAVEAVQRLGYQTRAENFRSVVNLALIRHRDLFKQQGRGKYTAR